MDKGFDPLYGARPLARVINENIKKPLSEEILFGKLSQGGDVKVDLKKSKLEFNYLKRLEAKPKAKNTVS